jgi:threonine dehydrogenase-like Zn-dependent dehydrogenase
MQFAKFKGADIIAMDTNDNRLQFCRDKLDVDNTIKAGTQDVLKELQRITKGEMPTVVIDATGNLKAINNTFNYLAHGGRYVLIGLQKEPISFSHPEFHKREGTLMSSRNATRQDFEEVISCIKNGEIDPKIYITHRVNFDEVTSNFESWLNPATNVIKALVEM